VHCLDDKFVFYPFSFPHLRRVVRARVIRGSFKQPFIISLREKRRAPSLISPNLSVRTGTWPGSAHLIKTPVCDLSGERNGRGEDRRPAQNERNRRTLLEQGPVGPPHERWFLEGA